MTAKERIEKYLALARRATSGPWSTYEDHFIAGVVSGFRPGLPGEDRADYGEFICGGEWCEGWLDPEDPNTQFIAASRSEGEWAAKQLLQAIEALESILCTSNLDRQDEVIGLFFRGLESE